MTDPDTADGGEPGLSLDVAVDADEAKEELQELRDAADEAAAAISRLNNALAGLQNDAPVHIEDAARETLDAADRELRRE